MGGGFSTAARLKKSVQIPESDKQPQPNLQGVSSYLKEGEDKRRSPQQHKLHTQICMYVYVYIYMRVCTYTYIYICLHTAFPPVM